MCVSKSEKIYDSIKNSRSTYGSKSFSLDSVYIQNEDSAKDIMKWILDKTIRPRKVFEIDTFATAHIQLGDIVTLDYKDNSGLDLVTSDSSRFVVYNIEYARSESGPSMTVYLSEV